MKKIYLWTIGSFCLGFAISGLLGLLYGLPLAISIVVIVKILRSDT